jgi:hypothetical protein
VGPNYVLDKGFLATGGSVAYAFGEILLLQTDGKSVARAAGALATGAMVAICQENVDAVKVATGKVVVDSRVLGISRVLCTTAAIVVGDRIGAAAAASGVAVARTAAAAQPAIVLGIALTAKGTGIGFVDVLLTPGATY